MPIKIGSLTLRDSLRPADGGVTDIVFRNIVRRVDPECMLPQPWSPAADLMNRPECRHYGSGAKQQAIGIQVFGHEPDVMAKAAQMAEAKGAIA